MTKIEVIKVVTDDDRCLAVAEARVTERKGRLFRPPEDTVAVRRFAVDQSSPASGRAHGGRWMDLDTKEPVDGLMDVRLREAVKAWMVCDWAEGALA